MLWGKYSPSWPGAQRRGRCSRPMSGPPWPRPCIQQCGLEYLPRPQFLPHKMRGRPLTSRAPPSSMSGKSVSQTNYLSGQCLQWCSEVYLGICRASVCSQAVKLTAKERQAKYRPRGMSSEVRTAGHMRHSTSPCWALSS